MDYNNYRRESKEIMCGNIAIGGKAPVSIQSMTNTKTENVEDTVKQIKRLEEVGCEIVRLAVPNEDAANAFSKIKKEVAIPLVADIHFDHRLAILAIKNGADKIRINPGNIGSEEKLYEVVKEAKAHKIPMRIGVNSGSLEKDILKKYGKVTAEGVAESAIKNIKLVEEMGFYDIVVSVKSSDIKLNFDAHMILKDKTRYPFHIGITESGTVNSGKIKSSAGISALLLSGIGDTMRVSLTGNPVNEIAVAKEILRITDVKKAGVELVSCPTCGRCSVSLEKIALDVESRLSDINSYFKVAVMGCEVNGPGEAKEADFGIAFGKGKGAIFSKGKVIKTVSEESSVEEFIKIIEEHDRMKPWNK